MAIKIQVKGMADFERAMAKAGRVAETEFAPIVLGGAKIASERVQFWAKFSSWTGAMRRAITARLSRRPKDLAAYVYVDMDKLKKVDKHGKKIRYPFIVEAGAKPHVIIASDKKLAVNGMYSARVKHPGFKGRRFFEQGVKESRRPVQKYIVEQMKRKIEALNNGVTA